MLLAFTLTANGAFCLDLLDGHSLTTTVEFYAHRNTYRSTPTIGPEG